MSNRPTKYLWWLTGYSAIFGIAEAFLPQDGSGYSPLTLPLWVAFAILLFNWCKAHSQTSGIKEPTGSAMLCGLFAPIGVPLYFFRGFGFKKGLTGIVKAIAFYFLFALTYGAASMASDYLAHNTSLNLTRGAGAPLAR